MELKAAQSVCIGIVVYSTDLSVLNRTLLSLISSTVAAQLIVACNSAVEEYREEVRKLCHKYGGKFLAIENRGFGSGHNDILKEVQTEWYVCCNPDIEITQNCIERLLDCAKTKSDAILLGPKVLNLDKTVQQLSRRHISVFSWVHRQLWRLAPNLFKPYEMGFDYSKTQELEFVSGCFFMIKTEHMRLLKGFDNRFFLYCEDADLSRRANKLGKNYFVADAVIYHVWEKAWTSSTQASKVYFRSLWQYFCIHGFFRVF